VCGGAAASAQPAAPSPQAPPDRPPGCSPPRRAAARTRLRRLAKEAAAAGGGAVGAPAREYDAAQFEELAARYEKLNWRMVSKPGGATVRPDDFYRWAVMGRGAGAAGAA
jgi:hypothetical protein